jgi:hypothetical protein
VVEAEAAQGQTTINQKAVAIADEKMVLVAAETVIGHGISGKHIPIKNGASR